MQHVYPTGRGAAVKHHPLHRDTPTPPGCLQTLWANQTGSFIVPTALMSPSPQHCNSRESPARGHTVPVTQEKRRSKYAAEGRKKIENISSAAHSPAALRTASKGVLLKINFKGLKETERLEGSRTPLCAHISLHQHKMRCLGSTSNCRSYSVIEGDKTFWCHIITGKKSLILY